MSFNIQHDLYIASKMTKGATALERIIASYKNALAGKPVRDADEVILEAESALRELEEA